MTPLTFSFYKWRAKLDDMDDMDEPHARRLRELERENAKLRRLSAEAPPGRVRAQERSGVKH